MQAKNDNTDTIAAIATPPGRGGVAVIRVSGPQVLSLFLPLFKQSVLPPRQAVYTSFFDEEAQAIDDGLALYFKAPNSFTGEEVLELQGHGGPVVVDALLQRLLQLGVRLARPGEFSERAFLNGKMDLVQAEAVADLIDAASTQAAKLALKSLHGDFSKAVHAVTDRLIQSRLYLEAMIDFADEAIDYTSDEVFKSQLTAILQQVEKLQQSSQQGSLLREGIDVVIAGEPNVGKSSLLNAISGKPLAIVTPIAGTTRDVLRDRVLLDDLPIHLIDTAGLRESDDVVEQEGIRRARLEIAAADLVLYLIDATKHHTETALMEAKQQFPNQPIVLVRNKVDALNEPASLSSGDIAVVSMSALTHEGLPLLKQTIQSLVGFQSAGEGLFLARRRHLEALAQAKKHLMSALDLFQSSPAIELIAEECRLAQTCMNEITGEFTSDDLLGRIFSTFCIGK